MRLVEINKNIQDVALAHRFVKEYGEGDVYEHLNTCEHKYPLFFTTLNSGTKEENYFRYSFTFFVIDRLTESKDNELQVQDISIVTLQQVLNKMRETFSDLDFENIQYNIFTEQFADLCAGCFCNVDIVTIDNVGECSDFIYTPTKDIKLQAKQVTITENGTIDVVADANFDGLSKVTITTNVPQTTIQEEKDVTITSNGDYFYTADSGFDAIEKINVSVDVHTAIVEPLKTFTITKDNASDLPIHVEPSATYDAMADVVVDAVVAPISINPTTSTQVITPTSENLAFFDGVTVQAVTNSIDSNIQPQNIKKDITILGVTGTFEGGGDTLYESALALQNNEELDRYVVFDYYRSSPTYNSKIRTNVTGELIILGNSLGDCRQTYAKIISVPDATSCNNNNNFYDCQNLEELYCPILSGTNQYFVEDCHNLIKLYLPNCTYWHQQTLLTSYYPNLIDITVGEVSNSVNLVYWRATNIISDSQKVIELNVNLRQHFIANIQDRSGIDSLTITFSAQVYNVLEQSTIDAITSKNWTIAH